jgi:nicotinate-nucleotide adenylyltransferase
METSTEAPARLGILGGTFDPIHIGHLVAASEAINQVGLDRVILVPAGRPWQKSEFSDAEDRVMMTTLAAATHPRLSVSRLEVDRKGPTFTVDTLEALRASFADTELFFIVGADVAMELKTWHRVEDIASLATVVAVTRPGSELTDLPTGPGLPEVKVMEMPALDVSSTDIRRRVAGGAAIDYLVPSDIVAYIRDHGLYAETMEARGA